MTGNSSHYLHLERPSPCSAALFASLKGRARGARMTPAGLRSLFRHHRQTTNIQLANPHRFRHTFASDMIRAIMADGQGPAYPGIPNHEPDLAKGRKAAESVHRSMNELREGVFFVHNGVGSEQWKPDGFHQAVKFCTVRCGYTEDAGRLCR